VVVFEDESGFYLLLGLVRTYAPKARTPVIREKQTHDHRSVMGGMAPPGKVYPLARQESLNGSHTIEFLLHLLRVAGERLLVIWDGSPIYRRVPRSRGVARAVPPRHRPTAPETSVGTSLLCPGRIGAMKVRPPLCSGQ
jgi:hypothetical protein